MAKEEVFYQGLDKPGWTTVGAAGHILVCVGSQFLVVQGCLCEMVLRLVGPSIVHSYTDAAKQC